LHAPGLSFVSCFKGKLIMQEEVDDKFYERADAHIHLSNGQINKDITSGKVSASFMYSVARFNSWVSACNFQNSEQMREAKDELIEYFTKEYRQMLEENLEDYTSNFDSYMQITDNKKPNG